MHHLIQVLLSASSSFLREWEQAAAGAVMETWGTKEEHFLVKGYFM